MKPFIKMDSSDAWLFLIFSIFIPPLFIINLIVMLCQVVPSAIKNRKEQKEIEEFLIKSEINNMQLLSISDKDKIVINNNLDVILDNISSEKDKNAISFFQVNLNSDFVTKGAAFDFIDFLISLYDSFPTDLGTKTINNCIEVLEYCLEHNGDYSNKG